MEEQSLKTSLVSSPLLHWNWLRIAKLTSQFALGVVLLWWIVDWLSVDGRRLAQVFVDASFIYLSWAVICFTLSMFLKMLQYSLLLPARVSSKYMFGLILSQHALLTFLPWRLGEISVPVWLSQDQKIPLANSVPSIIAIRSVDLLIVVVVAMAAISIIDFDVSVARVVYGLGIAAVLVCVGEFSARWFRGQTLLKKVAIAIKPIITPFRIGKLILLSAAIFILSTLQSLAALHAFGFAISICDVALLNALTLL